MHNAPEDIARADLEERPSKPDLSSVIEPTRRRSFQLDALYGELTTEKARTALDDASRGRIRKQALLFSEMQDRDPSLHALLWTRKAAVIGLERVMLPATVPQEELDRAKEIALDTAEVIDQIQEFDSALLNILDNIAQGLSVSEIIWRLDGTVDELMWIPAHHLSLQRLISGAYSVEIGDWLAEKNVRVMDHPAKFIVHRSRDRAGNPARAGVMRSLVFPFLFRMFAWRDWSVFCERFGQPFLAATVGPSHTDIDELSDMLQNIGAEGWGVFSKDVTLQAIELANRGVNPYEPMQRAVQEEYAIGVLGQSATALSNLYGTKGDSSIKQMVRQDILEADCSLAEATLKRDLLWWIVYFRHGEEAANRYCPTLHFKYEPEADYATMATTDQVVLNQLGLGRRVTLQQVAERYGWELQDPEDIEEEDLVSQPGQAPAGSGFPSFPFSRRYDMAADSLEPEELQTVDDHIERQKRLGSDAWQEMTREVMDAMRNARHSTGSGDSDRRSEEAIQPPADGGRAHAGNSRGGAVRTGDGEGVEQRRIRMKRIALLLIAALTAVPTFAGIEVISTWRPAEATSPPPAWRRGRSCCRMGRGGSGGRWDRTTDQAGTTCSGQSSHHQSFVVRRKRLTADSTAIQEWHWAHHPLPGLAMTPASPASPQPQSASATGQRGTVSGTIKHGDSPGQADSRLRTRRR